MEGFLKTGVMARQAIEARIEHIDFGLEKVNAVKVPGCGDEFLEESLLEWALRIDLPLILRVQNVELGLILRNDGLG